MPERDAVHVVFFAHTSTLYGASRSLLTLIEGLRRDGVAIEHHPVGIGQSRDPERRIELGVLDADDAMRRDGPLRRRPIARRRRRRGDGGKQQGSGERNEQSHGSQPTGERPDSTPAMNNPMPVPSTRPSIASSTAAGTRARE